MKRLLVVILLLCVKAANAQYDNFYKGIVKAPPIFKLLKANFNANKIKTVSINGVDKKHIYSYLYKGQALSLEYCYPESKVDSGCSYFVLNGKRINLKGRFESDFACDLDITSFSLYQANYKGKKYVLLTCTNTGSGSSTSTIICNLFDITNRQTIKYYPLWSKYGGGTCFGDFNKDGILDFFKVRSAGDNETLRATLTSLNGKVFVPTNDKKYILLRYNGDNLKTKERHWFN